jgi:DNA-directed RNA polymerase subunit H
LSKEKDEITFNVFTHSLVPKHIILSKIESEELLRKYKIKPFQLPKIMETDPAVMMLGAKNGDILKIIRKSSTAGEVEHYRYVVEVK